MILSEKVDNLARKMVSNGEREYTPDQFREIFGDFGVDMGGKYYDQHLSPVLKKLGYALELRYVNNTQGCALVSLRSLP